MTSDATDPEALRRAEARYPELLGPSPADLERTREAALLEVANLRVEVGRAARPDKGRLWDLLREALRLADARCAPPPNAPARSVWREALASVASVMDDLESGGAA